MARRGDGFSLLEVLVIAVIIGVLALAALPSFQRAIEQAVGKGSQAGLTMIYHAQRSYYVSFAGNTPARYARDFVELAPYLRPGTLNINCGAPDQDWCYAITGATETAFTATAERLSGQCRGQPRTIDQRGPSSITPRDWPPAACS